MHVLMILALEFQIRGASAGKRHTNEGARESSTEKLMQVNVIMRNGTPGNRQTQNPNKCTPYLRAISTKIEIISISIAVTTKNSSGFELGAPPQVQIR